jgi:hypothetical protein
MPDLRMEHGSSVVSQRDVIDHDFARAMQNQTCSTLLVAWNTMEHADLGLC